jgi:hypothetical protein
MNILPRASIALSPQLMGHMLDKGWGSQYNFCIGLIMFLFKVRMKAGKISA